LQIIKPAVQVATLETLTALERGKKRLLPRILSLERIAQPRQRILEQIIPLLRRALAENKIILCSIRLKEGECQSPPYESMGNHIVVLCGVTDDGRVVVTDSALGKSGRGYLCQWWQRDFETVWMRTKGGVAMVICPPAGATLRGVAHLPPFPKDRTFPEGDDH